VAGALLDIYSSGLNLLTLGLRRPRYQSVAIDGAIMILGNIYVLFIAKDCLGTFQGFLLVLGVPLAAWAASSWWTWPRCAATATTSARCTGRELGRGLGNAERVARWIGPPEGGRRSIPRGWWPGWSGWSRASG